MSEMTKTALKSVIKRCVDNKDYKTAQNYVRSYKEMKGFDSEKSSEYIRKAMNTPKKDSKTKMTSKEE